MARGRRNRGRRPDSGHPYAPASGDDATMMEPGHSNGRGVRNQRSSRFRRGGRRGDDINTRRDAHSARRTRNTYSREEDALDFGMVSPVESSPLGTNSSSSSGLDAGVPAASNPFVGLYPHNNKSANDGKGHGHGHGANSHPRHPRHGTPRPTFPPHHGGSSPRHQQHAHHHTHARAGGGRDGVPNRHCAECRSVRKTNLRLRDMVLQYIESARRVLLAWSSEVGVPFGFAEDEMDWQPEPLIRVLLLPHAAGGGGGGGASSSDASGGGGSPGNDGGGHGGHGLDHGHGHGGGHSTTEYRDARPRRESWDDDDSPPGTPAAVGTQHQRAAAYMAARGLGAHAAHPSHGRLPMDLAPLCGRPLFLDVHPQHALPGRAYATATPYGPLPVGGGGGSTGFRGPRSAAWAPWAAQTTVEEYDEPD